MTENIIVALIGAAATIIAAAIGYLKTNKYKRDAISFRESSFVRFLKPNESFDALVPKVKSICMYTINSYELLNKVNTMLEQNKKMTIKNLTILVRKKDDESEEDLAILNNNISLWENLKRNGRIKKLTIISYKHDPDQYYTILGDRLVFCGHVFFDSSKPTNTTVDYTPLVFIDENEVGQRVIQNYQKHFDNMVKQYRDVSTLYPISKRT